MSIDKLLIAVNAMRDYKPDLTDIEEVFESVSGDVMFKLEKGQYFKYNIKTDCVTAF